MYFLSDLPHQFRIILTLFHLFFFLQSGLFHHISCRWSYQSDLFRQIPYQSYLYHLWDSDLFNQIYCHWSYLSDLFHKIISRYYLYLYHAILYFHHMLYFLLSFFLVSSILLSYILLRCQIIFLIFFFFVHIFKYQMVQLLFIIIQHWGYLNLHPFLSGHVIYKYRGNFLKWPCKPIIFLINNISTIFQYITWHIHLFTSITYNCLVTGGCFACGNSERKIIQLLIKTQVINSFCATKFIYPWIYLKFLFIYDWIFSGFLSEYGG